MPATNVLKSIITRGGIPYPLFSGVMSAQDLVQICAVPSFNSAATQSDLASNIIDELFPTGGGAGGYSSVAGTLPGTLLPEPTTNWQRPEDPVKLNQLGGYYLANPENLMPNPIIIAVRGNTSPTSITFNPFTTSTVFGELDVTIPVGAASVAALKPFFVIDGQHRLKGFARNPLLANTEIPFVLLWDDLAPASSLGCYTMSRLAGIFATVTTQATDLAEPHRNWMSFSFGLHPQIPGSGNIFDPLLGSNYRQAYEVALLLAARNPLVNPNRLASSTANTIFEGNVRLNPNPNLGWGFLNGGVNGFGMKYTINELAEVINNISKSSSYETELLAYAVASIVEALFKIDSTASAASKIFPNAAVTGFKIIREGVVNHILELMFTTYFTAAARPPLPTTAADWEAWLTGFSFAGDWSFPWTTGVRVGGKDFSMPWSGRSKNVLDRVLTYRTETPPATPLPCHTTDINDSLKGIDRCIRLVFVNATPSGKASQSAPAISAAITNGWNLEVNATLATTAGDLVPPTVSRIDPASTAPATITKPPGGGEVLVLIHGQTQQSAYLESRKVCYNSNIIRARYISGGAMPANTELSGIFSAPNGFDVSTWPAGVHTLEVEVCSLGADTWRKHQFTLTI